MRGNIEILDKVRNRDWLYYQYVTLNKSSIEISKEVGCSKSFVLKCINLFNIEKDVSKIAVRRKENREKMTILSMG